jgi:putative spermidine/putrescine transport system ATP-binding protein
MVTATLPERRASKLTIRDLRKTYGPVVGGCRDKTELLGGEFLNPLWPSGSGKTTMLMMIAGLIQPDAGEVWIDGRLATYAPPHKRDIGMVFQNYALFPHLTVAENIAFPLRMRRAPEAEIRREVQRVLDLIQLPEVGNRLPRALSGGQQQRIALARCIVYQPSIVLMDEPLGALDKKLRDQMKLEIKRLHKELGITVLYVTHDQEEAMIMSDRICLMNDARIEQIGSPADLYFKPRSEFAADFLGESNMLDATIEAADDNHVALRSTVGAQIKAVRDRTRPTEVGQRVKVMVRPEMIALVASGGSADNILDARLVDVILVGGITKHYVRLADGTVISATGLTRGPIDGFEKEATVRIGWPKESTVILASESRGRATPGQT